MSKKWKCIRIHKRLICDFRVERYAILFEEARSFSASQAAKDRLAGATADSLLRLSGSSLDEGQDIRNLHLPEVAAAPSNFVPDLPRIAECRSPRSETVSSFSLFYDGRSRMALTRYRNCFRDPRLCAACLTNWSIPNKEWFSFSSSRESWC